MTVLACDVTLTAFLHGRVGSAPDPIGARRADVEAAVFDPVDGDLKDLRTDAVEIPGDSGLRSDLAAAAVDQLAAALNRAGHPMQPPDVVIVCGTGSVDALGETVAGRARNACNGGLALALGNNHGASVFEAIALAGAFLRTAGPGAGALIACADAWRGTDREGPSAALVPADGFGAVLLAAGRAPGLHVADCTSRQAGRPGEQDSPGTWTVDARHGAGRDWRTLRAPGADLSAAAAIVALTAAARLGAGPGPLDLRVAIVGASGVVARLRASRWHPAAPSLASSEALA